jgi:steroid delta-isomerase-like uncharacterized protein
MRQIGIGVALVLVLVLAVAVTRVLSQEDGGCEMCEENKAIVRRNVSALNEKNLDRLNEWVAADFVHNFMGSSTLEDYKQGTLAMYAAFPDFHIQIDELVAEGDGDKVVLCWTGSGTQKGEWGGIPPTGNHITWTAISIFRIADGKLVEERVYPDMLAVFTQLGVIPPLGEG